MAGSHVEEGGEQVRGKDSGPSTRGRKDKSRDAISSLKGRFVRLELRVADTKEGMDFLEQSMEKAVEDLKVQIQDLQEGMQKLVDSCGVTRGVRDFSRQGLEYAR